MSSSKHGSSSGGGDDPFKNSTPGSMSKKLKETKKKRGSSRKEEEEQTSRRRTQNRNSQRAYRERREQRLRELEAQVQEAELLSQTLTTAYQGLKAEMDALQLEKAQEQYYDEYYGQAGPSYDPAFAAFAPGAPGYGDSDPTLWDDSAWVPEGWQPGDNSHNQGA